MLVRRLLLIVALCFPLRLVADARNIPWAEFLAPATIICTGEVVASRILDDPSTLSYTDSDGATVIPLQTYMLSTVRVSKSLRGACPSVIDLKWQVPIPFPVFDLDLDHVRSEWVLFLGESLPPSPNSNPAFAVLPQQAWKRELLNPEEGRMIAAYHPQHIRMPDELSASSRIKVYCRGNISLIEDRFVPEELLLKYFSGSQ